MFWNNWSKNGLKELFTPSENIHIAQYATIGLEWPKLITAKRHDWSEMTLDYSRLFFHDFSGIANNYSPDRFFKYIWDEVTLHSIGYPVHLYPKSKLQSVNSDIYIRDYGKLWMIVSPILHPEWHCKKASCGVNSNFEKGHSSRIELEIALIINQNGAQW